MANGKVITGFSKPYVAQYSAVGGTVTYTNGQILARGVSANLEAESGDAQYFYADNITAESVGGVFTGANLTLIVDGLKEAARKLIMGLPTASSITVGGESVSVLDYDDRQAIPYVGIGFIIRYMSGGVTTYAPVLFTKCQFNEDGLSAETQGENIEFQTEELTAAVLRDDSTNHTWRRLAADQETEAAAEAVLKAMLNIA